MKTLCDFYSKRTFTCNLLAFTLSLAFLGVVNTAMLIVVALLLKHVYPRFQAAQISTRKTIRACILDWGTVLLVAPSLITVTSMGIENTRAIEALSFFYVWILPALFVLARVCERIDNVWFLRAMAKERKRHATIMQQGWSAENPNPRWKIVPSTVRVAKPHIPETQPKEKPKTHRKPSESMIPGYVQNNNPVWFTQ